MRKHILFPVLALILGGIGAALRMWQLSGYQDGLPAAGDLAGAALLILCAAAAVIFLVLAQCCRNGAARAPYIGTRPVCCGMLFVSAGLLMLSAVLYLKNVMDGMAAGSGLTDLMLELVLVILSVPTVICMAFLGKDTLEGGWRSQGSLTTVMPAVFCWMWLVDAYRRHTAYPVLWDYVFLLLAIIAFLLAAVFRAGFAFEDGKPRLTAFVSMAALFLAVLSLADGYGLANSAATLGMIAYTLASLCGLLCDAHAPKRMMD